MHVNVTKLGIAVTRRDDDEGRLSLKLSLRNDKMTKEAHLDHYITPMLHSGKHIDHLCQQLDGEVQWMNKYAFPDLSYQIVSAGVDGLHVWYKDGGRTHDLFFTFPGREVAECIHQLALQAREAPKVTDPKVYHRNPTFEREYTEDEIAVWKKIYAPRFRYAFTDAAKKRYLDILRGTSADEHADLLTDKNRENLKRDVQSLANFARSASSGDIWTIHVNTDFAAHSFYWCVVRPNGSRYINGGIIAHPRREGPQEEYYEKPIVGYEYSVHT